MPHYLIGLGSSHPAGFEYIQRACLLIGQAHHVQIAASSRIMSSPAMGGKTSFAFTNSALAIKTDFSPDALWFFLQATEQKLGRFRLYKNGPRTIDLDILWCFGHTFKTAFLNVPHPGFLTRSFALKPACEASKNAKWPIPIAFKMLGRNPA